MGMITGVQEGHSVKSGPVSACVHAASSSKSASCGPSPVNDNRCWPACCRTPDSSGTEAAAIPLVCPRLMGLLP
jgi:hypothetical protein